MLGRSLIILSPLHYVSQLYSQSNHGNPVGAGVGDSFCRLGWKCSAGTELSVAENTVNLGQFSGDPIKSVKPEHTSSISLTDIGIIVYHYLLLVHLNALLCAYNVFLV